MSDLHVYPLGDLIDHEISETCACLPAVEPVEQEPSADEVEQQTRGARRRKGED